MSSSSQIFESREPAARQPAPTHKPHKRRLPAWLLPAALVICFGAIMLWLFRDRLLPAQQVSVAPVVLIADIEGAAPPSAEVGDGSPGGGVEIESNTADFDEPMLFQAAGWFEPDPLPIRATALTDGVIEAVHVLEGETVTKGQPLASLISDDAELRLRASKRALEVIEAEHHMHLAMIPGAKAEADAVNDQIAAAEAKLKELEDLNARIRKLSKGTVSEAEVIKAQLAVDSQKAEVAAARSTHAGKLAKLDAINTESAVYDARIAAAKVVIAQNELALSRIEITSPVDGVVLELKAAPGQKKMLAMDEPDSATIAVLFETGKLQARVDVPLADARDLTPGQAAIVTSDFLPNREFRGRVTRIVGAADLQRNTLQAKVRIIDPDPRLRPEMLCRVKFLRPSAALADPSNVESVSPVARGASSRALFAPQEALFGRSGESASAWVVGADRKRAVRRDVILGSLEVDGHIAVQSGLLAGQLLILPPHEGLTEGRRIRISQPEH